MWDGPGAGLLNLQSPGKAEAELLPSQRLPCREQCASTHTNRYALDGVGLSEPAAAARLLTGPNTANLKRA